MPLTDYTLNNFCAPELSKLTECGAPEITNTSFCLESAVLNFLLRARYDDLTQKLATNLVRRTDHAVFEYQQGRRLVVDYVARRRPHYRPAGSVLRAMCHFEQCILNLYLAVEIWEKMTSRNDYYKKGHGQPEERLHDIFINIKHFPQVWQKDASALTPIWLTNDGIASLRTRIAWTDLKAALDTLMAISEKLMLISEPSGGPAGPVMSA